MALVKCIECQSEVSDRAATCPRCGIANPGSGQAPSGTLAVYRAKQLFGSGSFSVLVNGASVGQLKNGESVMFTLPVGHHTIAFNYSYGSGTNTATALLGGPIGVVALQGINALDKCTTQVDRFEIIEGKKTTVSVASGVGLSKNVTVSQPE